jgi:Arc/MetJ family transcription regulator
MMRITVDVDEKILDRICRTTGERKKSPAVRAALEDYLRMLKKRDLINRVMEGRTDYSTSNEELEKRSRYDAG